MNNAFLNEKLNARDTLTPHIDAIWLSISDSLISFSQWMHLTFGCSKYSQNKTQSLCHDLFTG